jgi:hypothetical protein
MARALTFKAGDREYPANPTLIDRKKLYGWTENLALDDEGNECKLVTMDESGSLIPKGGTGLGILSPEGNWVERSQMKTVNLDGTPADLLPSSYNVTVELTEKVSEEVFLNHSINSFYQLDNIEPELIEWIGNDIYCFNYCYKDSYEGKPAFLLVAEDAEKNPKLFMMIGIRNEIEMLSLEQSSFIEEDVDQEDEGDADEMDFSMF